MSCLNVFRFSVIPIEEFRDVLFSFFLYQSIQRYSIDGKSREINFFLVLVFLCNLYLLDFRKLVQLIRSGISFRLNKSMYILFTM